MKEKIQTLKFNSLKESVTLKCDGCNQKLSVTATTIISVDSNGDTREILGQKYYCKSCDNDIYEENEK